MVRITAVSLVAIFLCVLSFASAWKNINRFPLQHVRLFGKLNDVPLELDDENAVQVLQEVRDELGTIFGYDPGNSCHFIPGCYC